ncbi:MAG: alpha/beta fold hydrolase [Myxococcales bacterium]|nr:alpha/beta fold hydrolase [Myxococcales bacterium]
MRGDFSLPAVALALAACLGCKSAYFEPRPKEAILHKARTGDGWEIRLVQYRAHGEPRGRPVLLCHGISANDRNMDLDKDHSMARWFASRGRDAWTVSLRGTGESDRINPEKGRQGGYDFDTLWREDLPEAIAYVREQSGGGTIDYVGHSMGGMLAYAYLSQGGGGLNAVATLGSPTRLDWGGMFEPLLEKLAEVAVGKESVVPMALSSQISVPLQGELPAGPVQLLLYNPRNVGKETWKRLVAIGTDDISGGVTLQIIGMVRSGRFGSADGRLDYRKDLAKVRTPVLVVAGKLDRLAIAPAVKDAYRALGGPKEWLLVSEANGAQADYGHMDLIVGDRAASEVWPKVEDFFERHEN